MAEVSLGPLIPGRVEMPPGGEAAGQEASNTWRGGGVQVPSVSRAGIRALCQEGLLRA